ncbi:MAG TPA: PspA/IM30 family protein [Armatimonadota bacterium]|jgi:phage shock protein A
MFTNWFTRIWRGFWGAFFENAEDPELTLKQLMRDMRAKVPKMRMAVASALGARNMAQADLDEAKRELAALEPQIIAAVRGGEPMRQAAEVLITRKQNLDAGMGDKERQLELTQSAADQAKQLLDAYESEVERRSQVAIQKINRNKQAAMVEQMAQLRSSFETGDDASVLDEVGRRIDERYAKAQGMLEVSGRSTEAQLAQVRISAASLAASTAYEDYQRQLGLLPGVETPRQLSPAASAEAPAEEQVAPPTIEQKQ